MELNQKNLKNLELGGLTTKEIAEIYGVSIKLIESILKGEK